MKAPKREKHASNPRAQARTNDHSTFTHLTTTKTNHQPETYPEDEGGRGRRKHQI